MQSEIIENRYGYFELKSKPTQVELERFYKEQYYQKSKGAYSKSYSASEVEFINNRINRKYSMIKSSFKKNNRKLNFLDIGCGEGWALSFFKNNGWNVLGLDYSIYGVESINPDCKDYVIPNNIYDSVRKLINEARKFDLILMDNVLEHLLDPEQFIQRLKKIIYTEGFLIVEVPNDFSIIQKYAIDKDHIKEPFWIKQPDHISYFNASGLKNLFYSKGWDLNYLSTDFPIDINILNPNTNYIADKTKGKSVHFARIEFENLLDQISTLKSNKLYSILADMGLGRNLIAYFSLIK